MHASIFWMAVNMYHEARNQPDDGVKAVGHVTWNRAIARALTIKQTVLQKSQFSWHNGNTFPAIGTSELECEAFHRCLNLAEEVYRERTEGFNFHGADHFHTTDIDTPRWAPGMTVVATIGQHIFYRSR